MDEFPLHHWITFDYDDQPSFAGGLKSKVLILIQDLIGNIELIVFPLERCRQGMVNESHTIENIEVRNLINLIAL